MGSQGSTYQLGDPVFLIRTHSTQYYPAKSRVIAAVGALDDRNARSPRFTTLYDLYVCEAPLWVPSDRDGNPHG